VKSDAATPKEYLDDLPPERRKVVAALRRLVRARIPKGYRETMNWGMITWEVPLKRYPDTYNGQPLVYLALAAQKNHYALYLHGLYASDEGRRGFEQAFAAAGKKLDMGKSCVRFRRVEDLPLDVVGDAVAALAPDDLIALHEQARRRG
jgi:hypothetical protein